MIREIKYLFKGGLYTAADSELQTLFRKKRFLRKIRSDIKNAPEVFQTLDNLIAEKNNQYVVAEYRSENFEDVPVIGNFLSLYFGMCSERLAVQEEVLEDIKVELYVLKNNKKVLDNYKSELEQRIDYLL